MTIWPLLLLLSPVMSATDGTPPSARAVLEALSAPDGNRLVFEERKMNRLLDSPQVSTGVVSVDGDRLEKQVTDPYQEHLVASRDAVTVTREGKSRTASLRRRPEARATFDALRALIEGDAQALLARFEARAEGGWDQWTLVLTPKSKTFRRKLEQLVVRGAGSRVTAVKTQRSVNDWEEMTFHAP